MNILDFIIIGGGPAGLRISQSLGESGFEVLLVEKEVIGARSRSWITWLDDIERMGFAETVKNKIEVLCFRSFLGSEYKYKKTVSAIIDCRKFLGALKSRALASSVKINELESFVRYRFFHDCIEIQTDKGIYRARYCVDASGYNSVIQRGLDGGLYKNSLMGCYAYEIEGLDIGLSSEAVIFDAAFPGKDYFWFLPYSREEALVGCFFFEALDETNAKRAKNSLERYIGFTDARGRIKTVISGNIPLAGRSHFVYERIFFAGDCVSSPIPSSGYGLLRTLFEADILAGSLTRGFKSGRFSYEKDILEARYPGFELHSLVSDILKNINDPLLDKAVNQMNKSGESFLEHFLKGNDLSITFSTQALIAIFETFTVQEIASMTLSRDYKELLFHLTRTYPKATPAIIRKELRLLLNRLPWYKKKKN